MSLPEPQSLSMMATVQDQYCSYWIECRHSIGRDMAWHELPPLMVGLEVGKFCEREQNYFQLPLFSPMVKLQHEFWPFRWMQKLGKFCEREQNYFRLPLYSPMVKLQHEFWSFKWFKKLGKFCEREQNYFRLSLHVGKDSFYHSKKVGLRPTFLEVLPYSSLTKWENFVNRNKNIFGCPYMSWKIHFTLLKRLAFGHPF